MWLWLWRGSVLPPLLSLVAACRLGLMAWGALHKLVVDVDVSGTGRGGRLCCLVRLSGLPAGLVVAVAAVLV